MTTGKFLVSLIVISAIFAGAGMYYFQVYAFYEPVAQSSPGAEIRLTRLDGVAEPIATEGFEGIDADSSPIRYRACFTTTLSQTTLNDTYVVYDAAEPLTGPGWFSCYDAATVGGDLETGAVTAYLGEENITYGVDRVVAIYDDGRAFVWHQLNVCGRKVFDGEPAPQGCPPVPERAR